MRGARRVWLLLGPMVSLVGVVSCARTRESPTTGDASPPTRRIASYTCPMHAAIQQHASGTCPLCGMALTPVVEQEAGDDTVFVPPKRRWRIGVATATIEPPQPLTYTVRAPGKVTDGQQVEAFVASDDVTLVTPGTKAEVRLSPSEHEPARARVVALGSRLDAQTARLPVRLAFERREPSVLPGTLVDVTLRIPLGDKLRVPEAAVVFSGTDRFVFVDRGAGQVTARRVVVGHRTGEYYELVAGLQPGEQVIAAGAFFPGAMMRIQMAGQFWIEDRVGH
ncbi:MAG: heavy metal-binding domain-containing protein [Myxococcota bacterium]